MTLAIIPLALAAWAGIFWPIWIATKLHHQWKLHNARQRARRRLTH